MHNENPPKACSKGIPRQHAAIQKYTQYQTMLPGIENQLSAFLPAEEIEFKIVLSECSDVPTFS